MKRRHLTLKKTFSFLSGIALAVSCALFNAACDHHADHARARVESGGAKRVTPNRIVGRWTSEPWLGQSGFVTDTICFSSDGRYTLTHTQAGPKVSEGTYSTSGEIVTFTWGEGQATERLRWEGSVLVLTTGEHAVVEHMVRRYHRIAGSC